MQNSSMIEQILTLSGRLHDVSKFRWGVSMCASYAAILTFPCVVIFTDWPTWLGTIIAAVFSVLGAGLRWHTDSLRRDAEELHRTTEYSRGLGYPVDRKRFADLNAKYDRLVKRTRMKETRLQDYYEVKESPCSTTLLKMLKESSWWTEQLARKMTRIVGGATAFILIVGMSFLVISNHSTNEPIVVSVYGLVICVIFSMDIFNLYLRYRQLAEVAGKSFHDFDVLLSSSDLGDRDALIVATNYQFSRSSGPPLPSWLWKIKRKSLNVIWQQTLSTKQA